MSRPIVTPRQLRRAIQMRVADAMAEGFLAGAVVGALLVYLLT